MRKQKTKHLLKLLGVTLLVFVLLLSVFACNAPTDGEDGGEDVEEVITPVRNGSFEYVTGDTFPKAPNNWTFTSEYTIESNDDNVYVYKGVIDVSVFNGSAYGLTANPGKPQGATDSNVLMLNNVLDYSGSYYSSAVTVEKDKFYKLTVNVKTALDTDSYGANVYVLGGSATSKNYLAKFEDVTVGDWTTYTAYIKGNAANNTSVYVKVGLGKGDEDTTDGTLAKGAAFFDEIAIAEIQESEYLANTSRDQLLSNATIAKYDLTVSNGEFDNASTTTIPGTPYGWYTKRGVDDNGENEAPTTSRSRGIIDINTYKAANGALKDVDLKTATLPANAIGSNVLMLYFYNAEKPSAHAYYSDAFTFKSEKQYKLTFSVMTYGIKDVNGQATTSKGVTVKLGNDTFFENVNTGDTLDFVEYTIYVDGSNTQTKSLPLYFWLGEGHEDDKSNYLSGAAFFDCVTLEEVSQAEYDAVVETSTVKKKDYTAPNIMTDNAFEAKDGTSYVKDAKYWTGTYANEVANTNKTIFGAIDLDNYDAAAETLLGAKNPAATVTTTREGSNKALAIYNKDNTAYVLTYSEGFTINPNTAYRLSFWVKTENIAQGKGLNFSLVNLNEPGEDDDATVVSVSNVNTEVITYDDDDNEVITNEWTEVVFFILGSAEKSTSLTLKVEFGTGTWYEPDGLLSGTAFMRNMYLENVTSAEYNGISTSTYTQKTSFRVETSTSVTNGNFNLIDADKTLGLENGEITNTPGTPSSWSGAYTANADETVEVISGITNERVFNNLMTANGGTVGGLVAFPYADGVLDAWSEFNGEPNLLMIWNKGNTSYGYSSAVKNLTASTFYKITINVRTNVLDTQKGAFLTISNGNVVTTFDSVINTNGEWATYTFFVKVGLNASNLKITLNLDGEGVAFFDNVSYVTVTEDDYNEAANTASVKKVSLTTDSFETSGADDEIPAPTNFKGAIIGNAPSGKNYTVAGVIDGNHFTDEVKDEFKLETVPAAHTGSELLAIFNKGEKNEGYGTAYAYTSSSYTLSADTYYLVSVWARVKDLGTNDTASIKLTLSSTNTSTFKLDGTKTEWAEYTFVIKTDKDAISGVNVALGLGEYNKDDDGKAIKADYATGYAFFDDFTIDTIDQDAFDAITESDTVKKITVADNDDEIDGGEDEETEGTGLSVGEIIAIISASLLSLALIIVLVIIFVKKIMPRVKEKKNKQYKKPTYDKRNVKSAGKDNLNKFKD